MDGPHPFFTEVFNRCLEEFFDIELRDRSLGELFQLIHRTKDLPEPRKCGEHMIRIKQLLPNSNTIIYYWDYGRVWQFFGIIQNENEKQLAKLTQWLKDEK